MEQPIESLDGTSAKVSSTWSESELRAIYLIQVFLEKGTYVKSKKDEYHFRPRLGSKTILKALEEAIEKFPKIDVQLRIALRVYRPTLLGKFGQLVARCATERKRREEDYAKVAAML